MMQHRSRYLSTQTKGNALAGAGKSVGEFCAEASVVPLSNLVGLHRLTHDTLHSTDVAFQNHRRLHLNVLHCVLCCGMAFSNDKILGAY
jgi:hypothetical protein